MLLHTFLKIDKAVDDKSMALLFYWISSLLHFVILKVLSIGVRNLYLQYILTTPYPLQSRGNASPRKSKDTQINRLFIPPPLEGLGVVSNTYGFLPEKFNKIRLLLSFK